MQDFSNNEVPPTPEDLQNSQTSWTQHLLGEDSLLQHVASSSPNAHSQNATPQTTGAGYPSITFTNPFDGPKNPVRQTTTQEVHEEQPQMDPETEIMRALETARESPRSLDNPQIRSILMSEVESIWFKLSSTGGNYVMTRNEFSIFNFFRHLYCMPEQKEIARIATSIYWCHARPTSPTPSQRGSRSSSGNSQPRRQFQGIQGTGDEEVPFGFSGG
ncbi:hypothetical protein M426DRAFT_14476 [Hypoxylon sp. CI-4A]|nr:hypothetical protein M426DRAFT_14476 [Hypoxylon sp. CI-4A]